MWDKSSASERSPQLEHFPADASTTSKIGHKQHTYLGKRMLQSTRIKSLKNRWLFVNSTSVVQNLHWRVVAVNSRQWTKSLSNCCTWSASLKESTVGIIYNQTKLILQYPSVYISQLFSLHQYVYFENAITNQTLLHCFKTEIGVSSSFNHKWYLNVLKPDKIWKTCSLLALKTFLRLCLVFYCF